MSRLPIPRFIQEIKTKLGFDRTMTATGEDVVDAVNKQAQHIGDLADLETTAKTDLVSAINNINPTRTSLEASAATEDDLRTLTPGCYNTTSGTNFGLPAQYGSLLVVKGIYSYGLMLFADSYNNLYYRNYYYQNASTKGWCGGWINLTAVTTGTIQTSLVTLQGETFLKKKNGNVGLELTFKPLEDIPAWTVFATIPEGFRPPKAIFSMDIYARDTNPIYQINPDGTIQAGFAMTASTQYRSVAIMWML